MKRRKLLPTLSVILAASIFLVACGQQAEKGTQENATAGGSASVSEKGAMDKDKEMKDKEMKDKDMKDKDMKDKDMKDKDMKDKDMKDKDMKDKDMKNKDHAMENMAPEFSYTDFDGNAVTLASLSGEKVHVKYWASWCPICLAGLNDLDNLAGKEAENGFKVLAVVTPDYKGEKNTEDFKQWFKGLDTKNIKVVFDDKGTFAKEFGVRGYPSSAYIGSDGTLAKFSPGHVENDVIIDTFKNIK